MFYIKNLSTLVLLICVLLNLSFAGNRIYETYGSRFPSVDFAETILLANVVNEYPEEIWSLREGKYKEIGIYEVSEQILILSSYIEDAISGFNEEEKGVLRKRFGHMMDIAKKAKAMERDQWKEEYVDGMTHHMRLLRDLCITNY